MKLTPFLALVALVQANAEDFITNNGTEYTDVTINRVEPDGLVLDTSDGIVKLNFSDLPADVRETYGFDPKKAKEFAAALAIGKAENRQRAQAGMAAELALKTGIPAPIAKKEIPPTPAKTVPPTAMLPPPASAPASEEEPPKPKPRSIHGIVKQRTDMGLLVSGVKLNGSGRNAPVSSVWLTGYDAKEGANISVTSVSTGTINYRMANGGFCEIESFAKTTAPSVYIRTKPDSSKYLTDVEAAHALGISRFAFIKLGITQIRMGKTVRYDFADIEAYVQSQKVKP